MTIRLSLPIPPSANKLWMPIRKKDGARMISTSAYLDWQWEAFLELRDQTKDRIEGDYTLKISMPLTKRRDADNIAKPVSDLLATHKVTADDRHCLAVSVHKLADVPAGRVLIELDAA